MNDIRTRRRNGNYKSRNGHCIIMQLLQADLLLVDWCKEKKGLVLKPNRDYYVNDWNAPIYILKYANQQIAIAPEHNDQTEAENVANIRASLDMQNNSIQSAVENPRRTNSVETNDSDAGVFSDTSSVS